MREFFLRSRWQLAMLRALPTWRTRVRFFWWAVVCRYRYEVCGACGGRVGPCTGSWWHADDDLWIEVVEPEHVEHGPDRRIGCGVPCPPCFTRRCVAKGIHVFWHARVEWRDGEDVVEGQRTAGTRA